MNGWIVFGLGVVLVCVAGYMHAINRAARFARGGIVRDRPMGVSSRVRTSFAAYGITPEPMSPMMDLLVIYEELLPLDDELARYLRQTIVAVHQVSPFASCKS